MICRNLQIGSMILLLFGIASSLAVAADNSKLVTPTADEVTRMLLEREAELNRFNSKRDVVDFRADLIGLNGAEAYRTYWDNRPAVGEIASVYMGDVMVEQRNGYFADCLLPQVGLTKNSSGQSFWAEAGVPICKTEASNKRYQPYYINFQAPQKGSGQSLEVSLREKNNRTEFCWHYGFIKGCTKLTSASDVKQGYAFVSTEGTMQRSIEYAGKSGSVVKFLYSEFNDRLSRDAFTREFQVDLEEGRVAAYKGLVFEILEANNAQIAYKIVRPFRS